MWISWIINSGKKEKQNSAVAVEAFRSCRLRRVGVCARVADVLERRCQFVKWPLGTNKTGYCHLHFVDKAACVTSRLSSVSFRARWGLNMLSFPMSLPFIIPPCNNALFQLTNKQLSAFHHHGHNHHHLPHLRQKVYFCGVDQKKEGGENRPYSNPVIPWTNPPVLCRSPEILPQHWDNQT